MRAGKAPDRRKAPRGGLTLAWQDSGTLLANGFEDLMQADWDEMEAGNPATLDPDWDRVRMLERLGMMKNLAAYRDHALIGYNVFTLIPRLHATGLMQAVNSVIYVAPEERRGVGVRLIRRAETDLRAWGAREIHYAAKAESGRTQTLFATLGYRHVESIFVKRFT